MMNRNEEESKRLDAQHNFMRQLAHGCLVQPSIPQSDLRAIADVATGTGLWLREAAQELVTSREKIVFTGFDISAQQFPKNEIHGLDFVVHNVVEPFPSKYHEKFDLVHVRLLSYALKAQDLEISVKNIVQLLRECLFGLKCNLWGYIKLVQDLAGISNGRKSTRLTVGLCQRRLMQDPQLLI